MVAFGTKDQLATLEKLQPLELPVNTLPTNHELYTVRSSFYYTYVINWLYKFKGYLRLASEYFDVELFEMELLNLFNPPPLDESVLFINKLKLQLINALTHSGGNSSKFKLEDFDLVIKKLFVNTSLGDLESSNKFDQLSLQAKFELFYTILDYLSSLATFRSFLDKSGFSNSELNFSIIKTEESKSKRSDWLLVFNDTKIIKRTIEYPSLVVPKKRVDCPEDPDDYFWDKFDIDFSHVTFDIECWKIQDFNDFIKSNQRKPVVKPLMNSEFQANVLNVEIKKRRLIQNRKKEYQLLNLMATRKKSSRLEAKERQKQMDFEDEQLQKENELKLALELDKISKPLKYNSNTLSREDRLKLRKLNHGSRGPGQDSQPSQSVEPESVEPESIEPEVEPESEPIEVDQSIEEIEAPEVVPEETEITQEPEQPSVPLASVQDSPEIIN